MKRAAAWVIFTFLLLCFAPSGCKKTFTNSIGMRFVLIPEGSFLMGSPEDEPERDPGERLHRVIIEKPFYMQETEVTLGQWNRVMERKSVLKGYEEHPADRVSYEEALEFTRRLNRLEKTDKYHLPTEAQWEYACRAGTNTPFYTGRCLAAREANFDGRNPLKGCPEGVFRGDTTPVASFPANPFGLFDMHGNVWEWCRDLYGEYPGGRAKQPEGPPTGRHHVLRGGAWSFGAASCRSASRLEGTPVIAAFLDARGLRVVMAY